MNERQKPDLSTIPPIGKLPDEETAPTQTEQAERVGRTATAVPGAPPAVGVEATTIDSNQPGIPSDEERELDKLRRG
ncbi:MAG: hypothetical protein E6I65_04445 [Chloroflexi bacterium]|nr:MAG: hypothetical protein E6I65_04445 [Chloroflexota bacterium]